jgi:type I restriction enzyme R subunit
MAAVKRMKKAFNLCLSSEKISDVEKSYIHFYCAVRSILFKLTRGDAPDIAQMNARVRELLEGAIQSDGIEELFETGKHISVEFSAMSIWTRLMPSSFPTQRLRYCSVFLRKRLMSSRRST